MNPSTIRGRAWGLVGVLSLQLVLSAGVAHALSGWTCYGQSGRAYRCSVGGSPQQLYDGSVQHACWSATGKYMYFNKTNGEIWRMGNDGSSPTKVCDGSASDKCPIATWRPDDESVLYVSGNNFYRVDGNTGTKHVVYAASRSYVGEFAINTSGNRIAARAGNGNLYKITVGGGESQYSSKCSASISPNGNYITHNDDGHRSMTIFNWGGGTYKTLNSNSYGWDNQRYVANDNDYIVYMYDHNYLVREGIGAVRVSSGAITHICDVPGQWGEAHPDFFVGSLPTPPTGNTAPSASISQPADGATFSAGATINYSGSATDAEDGSLSGGALGWELDRIGDGLGPVHTSTGTTGSYTFPTNITSSTTYYLNLTATDSGGMSDTDSITVYVDPVVTTNDPPTANLAAGPTSGDAPLTVDFNANSSDPDGDALTHEWDWDYSGTFSADMNSGADATVSNVYAAAGSFTAAVRVSDGHGHSVVDTAGITVTTPANTAPTAAITQPGDCQYYLPGGTMDYAGSGADAEDGAIPGTGLSWIIDRVGDGQPAVHTSTGATGSYTFPTDIVSSTRYYVDLTATDSGGLTYTVRIDVFVEPQAPNMPPAVSLTASPASGNAPLDVGFDANSSDPESDTLTHEWDWDYDGNTFTVDQNTGTVATANHQYAGAGTFTAAVRVSDGQGNTVTETVSVSVTSLTSLPLESHFDSNAEGWVYVDDAFRSTSTPGFEDGSYDPAGGLSGGGLSVTLGGGSGAGAALSGGWQMDFDLAAATDVVISFGYNLSQGSDYESDEFSQVLLGVDGTLHGAGANDYVDQVVGDGDGGVAVSTGWQGFQVTVSLAAGSHTVVIGGWNTQSTSTSEVTTIQFDDVSIQDASTAGPVISQHPTDRSVVEGSPVTFTVQATGTGTLGYQWYEEGAAIGGATADSYAIPSADLSQTGHEFYCAVTDTNGTAQSNSATLTVSAAGGDPVVSGQLKKWHRVTVTFDGPDTAEDAATNPFLDYRLNVTFDHAGTGKSCIVPGYYAAGGDAAQTSATSGNKWRVHFTPDEEGAWSYTASFRTGTDVAISLDAAPGSAGMLDGQGGTFTVGPTDKSGIDYRAKGLARYVGKHYLQFAETGEYYIKGGADSPENYLGYWEFDGTYDMGGGVTTPGLTDGLHRYPSHVADWATGDPTWQGGKGKGIIGTVNYLATKGMNSIYFLTFNAPQGDGRDTWMWLSPTDRLRYDVSKLDQWEIVFSHMDAKGQQLHVVTSETENDTTVLDGGAAFGTERKLYYRELVARFSHHLNVIWNIGEENDNSDADRKQYAAYIRAQDPYDHPVTVHTHYGAVTTTYDGLVGDPSFEATSIQGNGSSYNDWAIQMRQMSAQAGRKWAIYGDEQGPAVDDQMANLDTLRKTTLWGNLMGGGAGVEWYFGYQDTFGDCQSEDWHVAEPLWDMTRYALDFFQQQLPFDVMEPGNDLTSATGDFCLAQPGVVYAVYLPGGGTTDLDLGQMSYIFTVQWYNPRAGGALQAGNVASVTGPGLRSIGEPPADTGLDWVALVKVSGSVTTYALTVENGSGGGSYPAGAVIEIAANTPPAGQSFDRWTGETSAVADLNSAVTTVTMPAAATTVTATYIDAIVIECEDMTLGGEYVVGASEPNLIETLTTGTATAPFPGATGRYRMYVVIVKEDDGQPTLDVSVGGTLVTTITYPLGASTRDPEQVYLGEIDVTNGDEIRLDGTRVDGAAARADKIIFLPVGAVTQEVVSLTLIDADADVALAAFDPLTGGAVLNLAVLPNLSIRANTSPATVGSVVFDLDGGTDVTTENGAPYAIAGDTAGDYDPWTIAVGSHTLTVTPYTEADGAGTAGTALTVTFEVVDQTATQAPFGGTPRPVPGRIEVEDFDDGGEGTAYHDADATNHGDSDYRSGEGVDVEDCGDTDGGLNVGWVEVDEWLEYTVDVASAGDYDIDIRIATTATGRQLRVELADGTDLTGAIDLPSSGAWQTYETVRTAGVALSAGEQVIRLVAVTAQVNVNWIEISPAAGADELPVVAITNPTEGDTIAGTAAVTATAYDPDVGTSDGDGIASVLFELIGGSGVAGSQTENQAPYEWSLDPTSYPNGQYTLRATATSTGAAGGRYASVSITVTLENPLVDTDGDGIWDNDELFYGLDPTDGDEDGNGVLDGDDDWNGNGIDNKTDIANGTDPGSPPAPPSSDGVGCVAPHAESRGTGWPFAALVLALPLLVFVSRKRRPALTGRR